MRSSHRSSNHDRSSLVATAMGTATESAVAVGVADTGAAATEAEAIAMGAAVMVVAVAESAATEVADGACNYTYSTLHLFFLLIIIYSMWRTPSCKLPFLSAHACYKGHHDLSHPVEPVR
jgi:hypothetical protein